MGLTNDQDDFVYQLHRLADFLNDNPTYIPHGGLRIFKRVWADESDKEAVVQMANHAKTLAPCDKRTSEYDFEIVKSFGPHEINVYTNRENVCERKVVGTKTVKRYGYSAEDQAVIDTMQKQHVEATEEIVEWTCPPSLLSQADN